MNCLNCGAPMELVRERRYFSCAFCASVYFPEPGPGGEDGVQTLGQLSETACSLCGVELEEATIEAFPVLYCRQCRGVLATNDDFLRIVRKLRARGKRSDEPPTPIDPEELKRQVNCPRCQRQMDVHPYYGPGAVVVDTCPRCRLIWLDHGEIAVIQAAPGR